jgi:hypothetical protein
MKTMLMVLAMTAAVAAQEVMVVQESTREGELKQRVRSLQSSNSGTLLDMVDGTGGGWFYSEGGVGGTKVEGTRVLTGGGNPGMSVQMGSRAGGTLLDLLDR